MRPRKPVVALLEDYHRSVEADEVRRSEPSLICRVVEETLIVEETFEEPLPEMSFAAAPEQTAAAPTIGRDDRRDRAGRYEEPLPELSLAAAPPEPAMALDEFVATLARTEPPAVVEAHARTGDGDSGESTRTPSSSSTST